MLKEIFTANIIVTVAVVLIYLIRVFYTWDDELRKVDNMPIQNPKKLTGDIVKMKIYVINLDKRIDRKRHITKLLDNLGFINYEFVIPVPIEEATRDPLMKGSILSPAKMSNTLTFFKIFREAKEAEFIIMEDDINLYRDNISIEDVYNSAKGLNWDLLYMEFCFEDCTNVKKVNPYLYKLIRPICTGFVIYKKESGYKIIENYKNNKRAKDRYFADLNGKHIINSYGYPLFKQDPALGSDLKGSYKYGKGDIITPLCKF
jgi:hypothetical protein